MTNGLGMLLENWREKFSPDSYNKAVIHIAKQLDYVQGEMAKIPPGKDRAKWAHDFVQSVINEYKEENSEAFATVSCKAACSGCCHQQVEISPDEAALLAHLVKGGVKIDMEKLERQANLKHDALSWWRQPQEEKACLFLGADNNCRVYHHRPFSCRKYFVASPPEDCSRVSELGSIEVGVFTVPDAEILSTAFIDFARGEANIPEALWRILK